MVLFIIGKHGFDGLLLATIMAGAMMVRQLGEAKAADAIEAAVAKTTPKMKSQAAGKMGFNTSQVGDLVAGAL